MFFGSLINHLFNYTDIANIYVLVYETIDGCIIKIMSALRYKILVKPVVKYSSRTWICFETAKTRGINRNINDC